MSPVDKRSFQDVPSQALLYFLLLTLAITWGIAGTFIFFPEQAAGLFGELEGAHPLYFVATWGPGLAGFIVVLSYGGWSGVRRFLSRLFLWRCHPIWWALVLIGLPLGFMAGSLIKGGPLLAPMEDGAGQFIVLAVIMLFLGPVEEFGWRGVAQPILQRFVAPIWAGAIIGVVWGVWHIPAFYLSGTVYADWNLPLFLVGCVALAILVTPIFNASGGGLLLPVLFHWQLIMPFWPDAQPWDTWIFIAVTVVVVWLNRSQMFCRTGTQGAVIPN